MSASRGYSGEYPSRKLSGRTDFRAYPDNAYKKLPCASGYPGKSPWIVIQRQIYRIPRGIPIPMPKSAR
jgi:hypothetical protein